MTPSEYSEATELKNDFDKCGELIEKIDSLAEDEFLSIAVVSVSHSPIRIDIKLTVDEAATFWAMIEARKQAAVDTFEAL